MLELAVTLAGAIFLLTCAGIAIYWTGCFLVRLFHWRF